MADTVTPNREAEQAVIGACLLSPLAIEDARRIVEPTDFLGVTNAAIFDAILRVHDAGSRVDAITVHEAITGADVSLADLHQLQNSLTFTTSNATRYALAVAETRVRFNLARASSEIHDLAVGRAASHDAADAAERARSLLAGIDMPAGTGAPDPDVDSFTSAVDTTYDWLVPDFLERRDRMLVTAGEGAGKSVLLAQIAVQVAAGIHPWTWEQIAPRNVLLIDLENGERLVVRRLQRLRAQAGAGFDPQRLRIHTRPGGIDLTSRTDRNWLVDRCTANAAELLVIGPAYRMYAGIAAKGDIGGEEQVRLVTKALDEVRTRCNVALLLETHAPHGHLGTRDLRPFGSSVWLRWPEFGVGIARDRDDADPDRFKFTHWRGPRDERTWPDALQRGGSRWPWTPIMPTGTFRRTA